MATLFSRVADREGKHLSQKDVRDMIHPGARAEDQPSVPGPASVRIPGQRVGQAFRGQLAYGLFPFGALGLGRLARSVGSAPKVPTMPPFSCRGGRSSPIGKNEQGGPSYYREQSTINTA